LDQAAANAIRHLVAGNTAARLLNEKAVAVLVFPKIVKAGDISTSRNAGRSVLDPASSLLTRGWRGNVLIRQEATSGLKPPLAALRYAAMRRAIAR
jgi:hypothetical protein